MGFKILTDFCCNLSKKFLKENNIDFIGLNLIMDNKKFIDNFESEKYDFFLKYMKFNKGRVTTSQINIGQYYNFFKKYIKEKVIYISFSSGLSGSYNSSLQALKILKNEFYIKKNDFNIFDSKNASFAQGILVKEANYCLKKKISLFDTINILIKKRKKIRSFVIISDLKFLYYSGRISNIFSKIGDFINIKLFLDMDCNGKLRLLKKIIGFKKSLDILVLNILKNIDIKKNKKIYITYSSNKKNAELLKKKIKNKINIDIEINILNMVMITHVGFECLGVFFYGK